MAYYGQKLVNALIRCDASEKIGTGHVMRCLALAQAFKRLDFEVTFLSYDLSKSLISLIENSGFQLELISEGMPGDGFDLNQTQNLAKKISAKIIVLDGYHFGYQYQLNLDSYSKKTILIDDSDGTNQIGTNVILNQNIWASVDRYMSTSRDVEVLAGPRYALFRHEFVAHQRTTVTAKQVKHILVTPGGSDPGNITPTIIRALDSICNIDLQTKIVLGSMNSRMQENRALASTVSAEIEFFEHVNSMPDFMDWADIAISGGGFTTFELALLGVPSLFFIESHYQRLNVETFQGKQMAINLGPSTDCSPQTIATALQQLMENYSLRRSLSQQCMTVFDGKGAERVAAYLAKSIHS